MRERHTALVPKNTKVIQVAAYTDERSARALARRLESDGFVSYVSHADQGGKDRYRVRVRESAGNDISAISSRLKTQGLNVWVTTE
jgi:hypothetical protein